VDKNEQFIYLQNEANFAIVYGLYAIQNKNIWTFKQVVEDSHFLPSLYIFCTFFFGW